MTDTPRATSRSPVPRHIADRIEAGTFDDPFSVLGPHERGGVRCVTAFDPGATEMEALVGGDVYPLRRIADGSALFAGEVAPGSYRLRGRAENGDSWEMEDAYRFGPVLGDLDEYLLGEGTHRGYGPLGAHVRMHEGVRGTHFAVWAPNARRVSVVGGFNHWDGRRHPCAGAARPACGRSSYPASHEGEAYKYEILGADGGTPLLKADPVGFGSQHPPERLVVRDITGYGWKDDAWMATRAAANGRTRRSPSTRCIWAPGAQGRGAAHVYREAAEELVEYVTSWASRISSSCP